MASISIFLAAILQLALISNTYTTGEKAPSRIKRIINGELTVPGEYPFLVGIYGKGATLQNTTFCGGSIIDERWVLTAAHCVSNKLGEAKRPTQLFVQSGKYRVESLQDPDVAKIISVDEVHIHPQFNRTVYSHDIVVLRVSETFSWGSRVAKVKLSSEQELPERATTVGWGQTELGDLPPFAMKIQVQIRKDAFCKFIYEESVAENSTICATGVDRGSGVCVGDSGGPLLGADGKLIGIVSSALRTTETCLTAFPALFVRVSHYVGWIESIVVPEQVNTFSEK